MVDESVVHYSDMVELKAEHTLNTFTSTSTSAIV